MTQLLESSIQSSGLTERELEERLGWEPGLISRILDGSAEHGPLQLLEVLAELSSERERSRGRRAASGGGGDRSTHMVEELIERFRDLGYGRTSVPDTAPASEGDALQKVVEDALLRAFGPDLTRRGKRGG